MLHATSLDASLRALGHTRYMAGTTAWNDGQRGTLGNQVTPWGNNITDSCIISEGRGMCQYVKPHNLDETLGVVSARDIFMVDRFGTNVSVQDVLDDLPRHCAYAGIDVKNANVSTDERVVVRFQSAFVPVLPGGATKIAPQHFSYQTHSADDPRNLVISGTPDGIAVHPDGVGPTKLLSHSVTEDGVKEHWFRAEANDVAVGGNDVNGCHMGIRGMGGRSNCFVLVAIPNQQTNEVHDDDDDDEWCDDFPVYRSLGVSYAARVSRDTETVGTWTSGVKTITREPNVPIIVTVLHFHVVEGTGSLEVSKEDVARAVADLDHQYDLVRACGGNVCKLSELPSMLHPLTNTHMAQISTTALW